MLIMMMSILITTTAVVQSASSPAEKCIEKCNSCACRTASGYINLASLDEAKSSGNPKYSNIQDSSGTSYSYNPCTDFNGVTSGCTNVAACQTQAGAEYGLGNQQSATFIVDGTYGTMLSYTDGTRTSQVQLICDDTKEGDITAFGEEPTLTYTLSLSTKYACAKTAPPVAGCGSGGGGGGLSVGSILLIIFFVAIIIYVIGGVLFNKFYKGASGIELLPNVEFWKSLPGLAKDGTLFTYNKVRGATSSTRAKYDEV